MGTATNGKISNKRLIRACHPVLPRDIAELQHEFNDVFQSSWVTNFAKYTQQLEEQLQKALRVKHVLTVANASTGLSMALSILRAGSEVIVPSYTFPSTVNAVVQAQLRPRFVDVERTTCNISLQDVQEKITANTSAILAVNVFGNPCQIEELETIAALHDLKLFFDSAAALGAKYHGRSLGAFGHAEIFSLSGTKVVTSGEGGVITTNDDALADELRCKRNYGYSKKDNDCLYAGFNGKMSEFSAILALWSLRHLERELACRRQIAAIYHHRLRTIPGIQFQQVLEQSETNFCAFALEVDAQEFGLDTVALQNLLSHEGVETLRYFFPPMHKTRAYHQFNHLRLEQSEMLSQRNLCLPMHAHLTAEQAHAVCDAVEKIHLETAKYAARYGSQKTKNGAEEKQFSRKEWEEAVPARCAEADAIF